MTPDFADQEAGLVLEEIGQYFDTLRLEPGQVQRYKISARRAIAEALRKAVKDNDEQWDKATDYMIDCSWDAGFKKGFEAAREMAAKVVSETPGNTYSTDCDHDELAEQIRSLKPEGE